MQKPDSFSSKSDVPDAGLAPVCPLTCLAVQGLGYSQATKPGQRSRKGGNVTKLQAFIDHATGSHLSFKLS
jgi:hypothetical protein